MITAFLKYNYSSSSFDVQCAHRVASIGISDLQNGQILLVGAAGTSSFFLPNVIRVLIPFINKKRTKAIIIKFIIAETNAER